MDDDGRAPRVDSRIELPDGRRLAYADYGDGCGTPVVVFHGMPGARLSSWAEDVAHLADGLGLDRFAVLGVSGGGPGALVGTGSDHDGDQEPPQSGA